MIKMMNSLRTVDGSHAPYIIKEDENHMSDTDSHQSENTSDSSHYGHLSLSASPDGDRSGETPSAYCSDALALPRKGFNKNRKIIIRNVPPVRYEEVKDFMGTYAVSNISISKRARHAVATLVHGEQAEAAVDDLDGKRMMGTTVSVSIYPNECLLCVAHLPLNLDEPDFRSMVAEYGAIERAFLMVNREGRSKGYGFVEFAHNKELSTQARNMLDGKRVGSCMLHCDFLDTSIVSFEHLQSRCLYIDHLPQGFDNEMELRNIFSFIKTPTFFRLHSSSNKSGSFAVVEYENANIAEDTQQQGNGLLLCQQRIRVTFCLPGRPGIDIFSTLLAAHSNNSKQALLPNPTTGGSGPTRDSLTNPMVFNLLAQNPLLLQNFQKILQQLHQQTQLPTNKPGLLGVAPSLPNSPLMNPNLQVALLAVMLAMQLQQFEPTLMASSQLQAMITANVQSEQNDSGGSTRPSLLGNPMIAQANSLLQNLGSQQGGIIAPASTNIPATNSNNAGNLNVNQLNNWKQLLNLIQGHLGGNVPKVAENRMPTPPSTSLGQGLLGDAPVGGSMRKGPLLGVAPGITVKPGLLGDAPHLSSGMGRPILGSGAAAGQEPDKRNLLGQKPKEFFVDSGAKENIIIGPANPLLAIFLEGHIRQQLDSLQPMNSRPAPGPRGPIRYGPPPPPNPHIPPPHLAGPPGPRPMAQRRPPHSNGPSLLGQPQFMGNGRVPGSMAPQHPPLGLVQGGASFNKALLPNPVSNSICPQRDNPMITSGSMMPPSTATVVQNKKPGLLGEHPGIAVPKGQWVPDEAMRSQLPVSHGNQMLPEKRGLLGDAPSDMAPVGQDSADAQLWLNNGNHTKTTEKPTSSDWGHDLWEKTPSNEGQTLNLPIPNPLKTTGDGLLGASKYLQSFHQFKNQYSKGIATLSSQQEALIRETPLATMPPPRTPLAGMKRDRPHLLPSPETSPEGNYIGQHSQGIGGHYATSYIKKRRLI